MTDEGSTCGVPPSGGDGDRVMGPGREGKPLVIWDGDCGFCKRSARWMSRITGDAVDFEPSTTAAKRFPDIPEERFEREVVLVEPEGRITGAAEAFFRALAMAPGHGFALWLYFHMQGFAPVTEWCYRRVAKNRKRLGWIWPVFFGGHPYPSTYRLTRWIFLRLLGLIYLGAFWSLSGQILGLVGEGGLAPTARAFADLGAGDFFHRPSVFLWNASDEWLQGVCWIGMASGLLVAIGILQAPMLIVCWFLYLSCHHAGYLFLALQWDILLLETGFLAMFFAPWHAHPRRPRSEPAVSRVVLFLIWFLLFKLMLSSGITKLTWGDGTWLDLTALTYHHWTQPIPTPLAWAFDLMPTWMDKIACALMFVGEIGLPLLIFTPRRPRFWAAMGMLGLMAGIALSGNYGFFNLLAAALILTLLDDAAWPRWMRRRLLRDEETIPPRVPWRARVTVPLAVFLMTLHVQPMVGVFNTQLPPNNPFALLANRELWWNRFQLSSHYGLFRVMTTTRPEIMVEVTADGEAWEAVDFKFKPDDPGEPPLLFPPHMPRLDWQMWFAGLEAEGYVQEYGNGGGTLWLNRGRQGRWMQALVVRIAQRSAAVESLLAEPPLPGETIHAVRLVLWQYRFDHDTDAWWQRERLGVVVGPIVVGERE